MAIWRVVFDTPHAMATENGYRRAVHCADFRGEGENVFQCPVTNLLMLQPSVFDRDFKNDFRGSEEWNKAEGFWERIKRAEFEGLAQIRKAAEGFTSLEILITTALIAIDPAVGLKDDLVWALQSKFTLNVDEGFAIHHHALTDEFMRKNNWFAVQWDDILIHVSQKGWAYVYRYPDRSDLTQAPEFVERFDIAQPAELLNKSGTFVFLPIPWYGLAVYHTYSVSQLKVLPSNARNFAGRSSHLIKWPTRGNTYGRLFESGPVTIALNPYQKMAIGFQTLTYPDTGTYTDAVFDPGYKPSNYPSQTIAGTVSTGYGTTAAALYKPSSDNPWVAGTDRQGRVKITLGSDSGNTRTPFVYGYGVVFDPVLDTRDTTPITVRADYEDALIKLEWAQDEFGCYDGKAEVRAGSDALKAVAERGDATFQVEYSENDGADWNILYGGLAKDWGEPEVIYDRNGTEWYQCEVMLPGMEARLEEMHQMDETSFDNLSVADALNIVLTTSGFEAIADADMPADLKNVILKTQDGQRWKFAPSEGDNGLKIVRDLLLMGRKQNKEFLLLYDWEAQGWTVTQKPRDTAAYWSFKTDAEDEDFDNRIVAMRGFKFRPVPPWNVLICEGLTQSDQQGTRIQSRMFNNDAISAAEVGGNPNLDYGGRQKVIKAGFYCISEKADLDTMCRRLYPLLLKYAREGTADIPEGHVPLALGTNTAVKVYKKDGTTVLLDGWLKKRTIVIVEDYLERGLYELSTTWEGGIGEKSSGARGS